MNLFDAYPQGGRVLRGKPRDNSNTRHGQGIELQQLTKQSTCGYCEVSLIDDYYHWLLMSVDHVVPRSVAESLGIIPVYYEDFINLILCCSGCNGLKNRDTVAKLGLPHEPQPSWTLEEFLSFRDQVFAVRRRRIEDRRKEEQAFFNSRPWEV